MNLFNYLKTRITILDVVSEYAPLKKAGLYWKGQCPFHQEKTASFTVSPHKEIFYCFGCHVGGDVISFIARIEQCSQLQAAHHLIERYQIDIPSTLAHEAMSKTSVDKHYYNICHEMAQWCNKQLAKSAAATAYLQSRSISQESAANFCLGYFPGGLAIIKQFITHMAKQNILVDDLLKANILTQGKNVLFSPFEERIIFPITDHLGRFCGFGGRIFKPNETRPKYYNSHENEHFAKGSLLFGFDKAKREIQKKETVFLVEGYTDCIAMAQHGFVNTIATLGTACTLDHLTTLSRHAQQLYVLYDGDNAGHQAILRIGQLCWQASIDLKVICLPAQEDPASFLSKGLSLTPLIEQARDFFTFFIQTLGTNFNQKTLGQKLELARKVLDMIAKLDDPLKKDILLAQASTELKLPSEALKKELERPRPMKATTPLSTPATTVTLATPTALDTKTSTLENKVFFAILNNIHLMNKENEEFLITYLPHPLCDILRKLREEKEKNTALGFIQFFELLNAQEQTYVSKVTLASQEDVHKTDFEYLVTQLQKKHWKAIVNTIKIKLALAKQKGDEDTITALMQSFSELKKKIIEKKA
jgi:DNA primase